MFFCYTYTFIYYLVDNFYIFIIIYCDFGSYGGKWRHAWLISVTIIYSVFHTWFHCKRDLVFPKCIVFFMFFRNYTLFKSKYLPRKHYTSLKLFKGNTCHFKVVFYILPVNENHWNLWQDLSSSTVHYSIMIIIITIC